MTAPALYDADGMLASTVKEKLQYQKMKAATFRDQHGRQWSCEVSTETMQPCTPLTPKGWKTPHPYLTPPAPYLAMGEVFGELAIDYDRWLIDVGQARREYEQWLMQVAQKMYNAAAMTMIANKDPELMKMAGAAPMSPEFIRAMKSGVSKWVLGLLPPNAPVPGWAQREMHTLVIVETWDGSDIDTSVADIDKYRDDEPNEDAQTVADRLEAQMRYGDLEDDADPDGLPHTEPIKRGRGRPRKEA